MARIPPRLSTERLGWTIDDELTLQPSAASPRAARQFVVAALRRWGCEHLGDTVALLTSELVTNAVLHAGSAVGVSVARRRGGVRVEVSDDSLQPPAARHYDVDAQTGRGLALLEAQATAWGVEAGNRGKVIWFEVGE